MKHKLPIYIAGTLILMTAALYNGYPIMNGDTAAYLYCGFDFRIQADRPPYYGLFIRLTSLWASLWFTVWIQCLLAVMVVLRLTRAVIDPGRLTATHYVFILAGLAALTGVVWSVDQLMPDAFTGLLLVACLIYCICDMGQRERMIYLLLIALCIVFHNSHLLIMVCFPLLMAGIAYFRKWGMAARRFLVLFVLAIGCGLAMSTVSYFNGKGFTVSRGSHVFFMGKLAETGVLKKYLDDHCERSDYRLCAYKDQLGGHAWEFVWAADGPFQKTGGWDSSAQEYKRIIADILTTPEYLTMVITKSITSTLRQLTEITIVDTMPGHGIDSGPDAAMRAYFEDERTEFLTSRQNAGQLSAVFFNKIYFLFLLLSSGYILWKKELLLNSRFYKIYLTVFIFLIVNAFITATFANVLDRLQTRVFWVLPFINLLVIVRHALAFATQREPVRHC